MRAAIAVFILFMALQGAFWNYTREIMPEMSIVPDVPGERTVRALSFGDEEAFFRLLALNIQNSGDTFGRFTALYKYDFNKLYHWFHLLDRINNQSNYLPAMASYYFSQTQNPADVHYIVDYLEEYAEGRVKEKWWWLVQATYLAQHKMNDLNRALKIANQLHVRGIPIWAQQMSAFLYEERGEYNAALAIIQDILKHPEDFSPGELNFMTYFVKERLGKMEAVEKEIEAIRAAKKNSNEPFSRIEGPPPDVGAAIAPSP